ncbi:hypothetical protein SAMN05216264_101489 [Pseudomonas marincola]|nr:hypothetical protein SAMN05216264_101489 [Pseudomonas marincola]
MLRTLSILRVLGFRRRMESASRLPSLQFAGFTRGHLRPHNRSTDCVAARRYPSSGCWVFDGGWNPHRGFRHCDLSDSLGRYLLLNNRLTDCVAARRYPSSGVDSAGDGIRIAVCVMTICRIHSAASAPAQSPDGLRCCARYPSSGCWVFDGGWNPHRGLRHDDLPDSLGGICACTIARRIALLRVAIHPPGTGFCFRAGLGYAAIKTGAIGSRFCLSNLLLSLLRKT